MTADPAANDKCLDGSPEKENDHILAHPETIKALISGITDSVVVTDSEGMIGLFNPAAEKLFGYKSEDIVGKSVRQLMTTFDAQRFHERLGRHLKGEPTRLIDQGAKEVVARNSKGNTIMINLSIKPVDFGDKINFLCIASESTVDLPGIEDLHKVADHDSLTGLYNKNYMCMELTRASERCRRNSDRHAGLLRFNIDRFSVLNDKYGYAAGDKVITEIAERIRERLRKSDLACRLSGDEFVILAYDVKPELVETVAQAFLNKIGAPVEFEGKNLSLSISVGVYLIDGRIYDADAILLKAGEACKLAKRLGGNRIRIDTTASL